MNRIKKILLVVVLLGVTLLLTSCGSKEQKNKTPQFVVTNATSDVLTIEEFDFTNEKRLGSFDAWVVLFNGTLDEISFTAEANDVIYYDDDKNVLADAQKADATIKDYVFNYKNPSDSSFSKKVTYRQYLVRENEAKKVIDIVADYVFLNKNNVVEKTGVLLTDSYLFTSKNVEYYAIYSDGSKERVSIDNVDYSNSGFPAVDQLIENRTYVNYRNYEVKTSVSHDGFSKDFEFEVRLVASAKPLNTKTASFWNWLFLQMPIAFLMSFIGKLFGGSFAVGILFTTIIVRTLAWPIYAKTNDMSMKMSIAQPDIDRLNRKYATRKDPESQQKMQMEMMQIYKKHKINMFGCLLPFLQMPIFFAMFEVVKRITIPGGQFYQNVSKVTFLGINLETPGTITKIIFVLLVGGTMFLLQKISSIKPSYAKKVPENQKNAQAAQTEKTMKMVSYFMIFMMMATAFSSGGIALSFYWVIGNIYSIAQTIFNRRLNEKRYAKLEEEKLYGRSREIIDADLKKKGEK